MKPKNFDKFLNESIDSTEKRKAWEAWREVTKRWGENEGFTLDDIGDRLRSEFEEWWDEWEDRTPK